MAMVIYEKRIFNTYQEFMEFCNKNKFKKTKIAKKFNNSEIVFKIM